MSLTPPRYTPTAQDFDRAKVSFLPGSEPFRLLDLAAGQARVLDRLREWVNEYPNDRYTGQFWADELSRLLREEGVTE